MSRRNIKSNIIKIGKQEEIVNIDAKEENINEKIILQDDEHCDNIDLNGVDWTR